MAWWIVPYTIEASLRDNKPVLDYIEEAIKIFENTGIIRFQNITGNTRSHRDWIYFREATDGTNTSQVGRSKGGRFVELTPKSSLGTTLHEMMHSLGSYHEHARTDRDLFVVIGPGVRGDGDYQKKGFPIGRYDIDSIMQYPAINDKIRPVDLEKRDEMGQHKGLSKGDLESLRKVYGK